MFRCAYHAFESNFYFDRRIGFPHELYKKRIPQGSSPRPATISIYHTNMYLLFITDQIYQVRGEVYYFFPLNIDICKT